MTSTRRTVLATLPVVAFPDFSAPAPVARRLDDDAELIALCSEHSRQWAIASDWGQSDEASETATDETTRLNKQIAGLTPKTRIGLAWKARVAALENAFGPRLAGRDVSPIEHDDERILFSLLSDLIAMHGASVGA